jgi:hypothetical protein
VLCCRRWNHFSHHALLLPLEQVSFHQISNCSFQSGIFAFTLLWWHPWLYGMQVFTILREENTHQLTQQLKYNWGSQTESFPTSAELQNMLWELAAFEILLIFKFLKIYHLFFTMLGQSIPCVLNE